jgi:hypothetical protein
MTAGFVAAISFNKLTAFTMISELFTVPDAMRFSAQSSGTHRGPHVRRK